MANPLYALQGIVLRRELGISDRVDVADVSGSTCVEKAWHVNGKMYVIFRSGSTTYDYDVSDAMWQSFKDAASKGHWLHAYVL